MNLFWLPAAILLGWQLAATRGWLDPLFFPPPSDLVPAAARMIESGELPDQFRITLWRMLAGFVLGAGSGLVIGLLMGWAPLLRRSFEPLISALYTTPKLTLLPMLLLLMGIGDGPRIVLVAAGCFIMMVMHAMDAVGSVSRTYVDLARNYGASGLMMFRQVYIPATLPQLFTGFRLAFGRALMITVAVELISAPDGLGSMIWMAWQTMATEKLYIGVILIAAMGAISHATLRRLERAVVPWREA